MHGLQSHFDEVRRTGSETEGQEPSLWYIKGEYARNLRNDAQNEEQEQWEDKNYKAKEADDRAKEADYAEMQAMCSTLVDNRNHSRSKRNSPNGALRYHSRQWSKKISCETLDAHVFISLSDGRYCDHAYPPKLHFPTPPTQFLTRDLESVIITSES